MKTTAEERQAHLADLNNAHESGLTLDRCGDWDDGTEDQGAIRFLRGLLADFSDLESALAAETQRREEAEVHLERQWVLLANSHPPQFDGATHDYLKKYHLLTPEGERKTP